MLHSHPQLVHLGEVQQDEINGILNGAVQRSFTEDKNIKLDDNKSAASCQQAWCKFIFMTLSLSNIKLNS